MSTYSRTTSIGGSGNTRRVPRPTSTRPPSRPGTSLAAPTSENKAQGDWVVAILDSRGVGREVGVACMERELGQVIVTQSALYADSATFVKTMHLFTSRPPALILVPASFLGGGNNKRKRDGAPFTIEGSSRREEEGTLLVRSLRDAWKDTSIVPVARNYWNEQAGYEFISQLIIVDEERTGTILAAKSRYYALSACSALFKYLEAAHAVVFPPRSLRIKYAPLEGTCLIDTETAKNLELVANMLSKNSRQHLHGLLNLCYTPMASRLLRINILGPLTDIETIDKRLDAVEELIRSEERLAAIRKALESLRSLDIDKLIGQYVSTRNRHALSKSDPAKESEIKVSRALQLRTLLSILPSLRASLQNSTSTLLRTACRIFTDPRLDDLLAEIGDTINADAVAALTKGALAARTTKIYAVRAERKLLLEVARETYKENVDDAMALCEELAKAHGVELSLTYTQSGFVFTCAKAEFEESDLRKFVSNVNNKGKKVEFSNLELKKKNARINESVQEVFLMSAEIMDDFAATVRTNIACLYRAAEGVAMLDMLASFAVVSVKNNYVRPEWLDTLAIKSGRHPLHEQFRSSDGTFVPNDTYASDAASFQIILGANMSGKSTLLRQIALLYIMAQCGCYVPAEYASFRVVSAILGQLAHSDAIQSNMSTFSKEMSTMAMILSSLQSYEQSLVIVDELGRGTSPHEGIGIAHAIAEEIIKSKAFCFFATHFKELSITLGRYPNVVSLHLQTDVGRDAPDFSLKFHHRVVDGTSPLTHYGNELAKLAKLPSDVLEKSSQVVAKLEALAEGSRQRSASGQLSHRRRELLRLRTTLNEMKRVKGISGAVLADQLRELQSDIVTVLSESMLAHSVLNHPMPHNSNAVSRTPPQSTVNVDDVEHGSEPRPGSSSSLNMDSSPTGFRGSVINLNRRDISPFSMNGVGDTLDHVDGKLLPDADDDADDNETLLFSPRY